MKNLGKWMVGAALAIGGLGLAAPAAHAAHIGVYIGAGPGYMPPCPGPGYQWSAGYYDGGYWVPGQWVYVGGPAYYSAPVYGYGYYGRDHDDWDRDRGWGDGDRFREGDRGWGGDHFRGGDRGWGGGDHFRGGDRGRGGEDHGRR